MLDYRGVLEQQDILQRLAPLSWERAAMALAADGSPEAAEVLARQVTRHVWGQAPILEEALQRLPEGAPLVRAWACWSQLRDDRLADMLRGRPPRFPCQGRWWVGGLLCQRGRAGSSPAPRTRPQPAPP
ncbi:MAG: hypothetical protein ACYCW6_08155 [Candidatus Xenobia bacterium]